MMDGPDWAKHEEYMARERRGYPIRRPELDLNYGRRKAWETEGGEVFYDGPDGPHTDVSSG